MSFLKIDDPAKRNFIVEEFLKSKKNIQQNFLSERLGDSGLQQELTKLYKPIVDSQSAISKEQNVLLSAIKENSIATTNALQTLPASLKIQFPQYPSIEAYSDDPTEDIRTLELGDVATKYLHQYASDRKIVDTTFGIRSKNSQFYIGDTPIFIQGDDVTVGNKTYSGTPGLWELLTMKQPNTSIYDNNDRDDYAEILLATDAIRQPKNPNKPKASSSVKYREIIKPIWEKRTRNAVGKGVGGVIVISEDPNVLAKQLELRFQSFKAGNTGVRNEIVAMCDALLRQGVLSNDAYKNIMMTL